MAILNAKEIRYEEIDRAVRQNAQNQLYFNPPTLDALVATVASPTMAIGFEPLSGDEFALLWLKPGTPGVVPFRFNKAKTTGICSFGPVLALRPLLRCPRGKIHRIPFRVEDGLFIINVGAAKPVAPEQRGPRRK
ncbi:MAG TPA: hypothetical protein VK191_01315 [Symbiobacteriaceae bacterium]|nr:hypothetical protein [Symbiobacteriaceae bacterium]